MTSFNSLTFFHADITAVTTNTRPQRVFSSVWWTSINRYHGFSRVGRGKILSSFCEHSKEMSALKPFFCNILLKDLTPLHVKIMSNTNLSSVCWRKLKLSTYLHTLRLQPHIKLFQYTLAVRLRFCYFWILFDKE